MKTRRWVMSKPAKKRGRPATDDSRKHQYRLRLNDDELRELEYASERTGMTKSEVLRAGLKNIFRLC